MQFNHFLVKDDEPLLFHTGLRGMFAEVRDAVAKIIASSELRHIGFSHFESDECGSLNEWVAVAPNADVISGQLGARVNVNDCDYLGNFVSSTRLDKYIHIYTHIYIHSMCVSSVSMWVFKQRSLCRSLAY